MIIIKIFLFFFYSPILILMRVIYPLVSIKLHPINSQRLGHFLADVESFLLEQKHNLNKERWKINIFIHFYLPDPESVQHVCNNQVDTMIRRVIFIMPNFLAYPLYYFNNLFSDKDKFIAKVILPGTDPMGLYDLYPPQLYINKEEVNKGEEMLSKIGIPKKSKFVCLNVRDNAYLKKNFPKKNFNYHDYRNWKISNFEEAIKCLISEKIYVIRVGKKSEEKLNIESKYFIDVTNKILPDLFDVYVGSHCYFCISTQSGFDAIPYVFRKPIAYLVVPIAVFHTSSKRFMLTTKYHLDANEKILSISDIFKHDCHYLLKTEEFMKKKITLKDLSSLEIKIFVRDMLRYVQNNLELDDKHQEQKKFWALFEKYVQKDPILKKKMFIYKAIYNPYLLKKN